MPNRLAASPNTSEAAVAVTPSNSQNQPVPFRALWVGTGGDVSITFTDGTTAVFKNVPGGFALPQGGARVNATGTTASDLLAMY